MGTPVVVWIHGGALINGYRDGINGHMRTELPQHGYAIDYRLAPEMRRGTGLVRGGSENERATTTRCPRRVGWLDLVALRHAVAVSGTSALALTILSVLREVSPIRVYAGYRLHGEVLDGFPSRTRALDEARSVYQELEGFHEPVDGSRRYRDLPASARALVQTVE